jgi:hypothetical protein
MKSESDPLTTDRWISVDERLPDGEPRNVLTVNDCGAVLVGCYDAEYGWLHIGLTSEREANQAAARVGLRPIYVTHWRPLPAPPDSPKDSKDDR